MSDEKKVLLKGQSKNFTEPYATVLNIISDKQFHAEDILSKIDKLELTKSELSFIIQYLTNHILWSESLNHEQYFRLTDESRSERDSFKYWFAKFEKSIQSPELYYPDRFWYTDILKNFKTRLDARSTIDRTPYFGSDLLEYFIHKHVFVLFHHLTNTHFQSVNVEEVLIEVDRFKKLLGIYQISKKEILLFVRAIDLLLEGKKEDYISMRTLLTEEQILISHGHMWILYLFLINIVLTNKRVWDIDYPEILDIYKELHLLDPKRFYREADAQLIKNICTAAIRSNQIEWFHSLFNYSTSKKMSYECQEALKLCEVKILFHLKQYDLCVDKLAFLKPSQFNLELDQRRLTIMSFYELGQRVLVDNYLNTFKVFVFRGDCIQKKSKESNNNFIRILNKLNKTLDHKKSIQLLHDAEITEPIAEKAWVMDKIRSLLDKLG